MFQSKFADLVREKEYREKRHLSMRTIAKEAGLSLTTITRVKGGKLENVRMSTFEILCEYFEVKELSELLAFTPGKKE